VATIAGQTRKPWTTPAYAYLRDADKLPSTDEANAESGPLARVKLFDPTGSWTWYVCGFDPLTGLAFGVVDGFAKELGDFDINELIAVRGALGLPIERDLHWRPLRVSELLA
jgi:Protein of unknown function (DUF2958)